MLGGPFGFVDFKRAIFGVFYGVEGLAATTVDTR